MSEEKALVSLEAAEDNETEENKNLPATTNQMDRYVESFQGWVSVCSGKFDRFADYIAPRNQDEELAPENISRGSIVFGMMMVILIFGIFGLWATLAPIDSAAVSPGSVVLDQNTKTIDHLEGGIVEEIFVTEGQTVQKGDSLVRLDDTAAKARLQLYKGQYVAARAAEARLIAERDHLDEVPFPEDLLEMEQSEDNASAQIDSQRRLFITRREALQGKEDVLKQQIKQSEEEIKGLEEQIASSNKQINLLSEEIKDVRYLLKTGNAPKTRLLALERRLAEIKGEKGRDQALISRANQSINETKIQMYNLKTESLNEIVAELKDTQSELSDLEEQLRAAEDVASRVLIKAPITGQVTGLSVHTIGGVVAPNEELMTVVPNDDKLIVEAKVQTNDIDVVRVGLKARVRLLAFKTRQVPPVEGTVVTVSADRFTEERSGLDYYIARIEIDEEQLLKLQNVELQPGMPTEALIVTGSRSLFAYLMSPISESFNRSLREE